MVVFCAPSRTLHSHALLACVPVAASFVVLAVAVSALLLLALPACHALLSPPLSRLFFRSFPSSASVLLPIAWGSSF